MNYVQSVEMAHTSVEYTYITWGAWAQVQRRCVLKKQGAKFG